MRLTLALPTNNKQQRKGFRGKHSSLFALSVTDERKQVL
jgi:hypothetical protein